MSLQVDAYFEKRTGTNFFAVFLCYEEEKPAESEKEAILAKIRDTGGCEPTFLLDGNMVRFNLELSYDTPPKTRAAVRAIVEAVGHHLNKVVHQT